MAEASFYLQDETLLVAETIRDRRAFLALYDAYFPRVYTYFRYRCPDPRLCDDLTAQTFERALTHLKQFDPARGPFAAWLFGIARNQANAALREQLRQQELPFELLEDQAVDAPVPEDQAILHAERLRLLLLVQSLPARQRDLLGLKFSAGLTNRQIAALSGLSEQNVAVILFRTIRWLRLKLEEHD